MQLSIVIPTYNRVQQLRRVLAGLEGQQVDRASFEVIVVSDGSFDGTDAFLRTLETPLNIQCIRQKNAGVAAARNRGIDAASGELVLFLDDDVVPAPTLIQEHLQAHRRHGLDTVVLGPMLDPPDFELRPWVQWEQQMLMKQYQDMEKGKYQPTARQFFTGNTSLARRLLLAHGGFDTNFRRAEDVELAYRLEQEGVSFVFIAAAVGHHYADRSFEAWTSTPYHYGRNDVIFALNLGYGWLLPTIWREYHERHVLIRATTALCLDRPAISQLFIAAMRRIAMLAPGAARMAYSAIFNLRYYQGMADGLGGRTAFFAGVNCHAPCQRPPGTSLAGSKAEYPVQQDRPRRRVVDQVAARASAVFRIVKIS